MENGESRRWDIYIYIRPSWTHLLWKFLESLPRACLSLSRSTTRVFSPSSFQPGRDRYPPKISYTPTGDSTVKRLRGTRSWRLSMEISSISWIKGLNAMGAIDSSNKTVQPPFIRTYQHLPAITRSRFDRVSIFLVSFTSFWPCPFLLCESMLRNFAATK